jgi:hypothetical protein
VVVVAAGHLIQKVGQAAVVVPLRTTQQEYTVAAGKVRAHPFYFYYTLKYSFRESVRKTRRGMELASDPFWRLATGVALNCIPQHSQTSFQ